MQTNNLDTQELADLLEQSKTLSVIDHGALRMYVLEFDRQDILVFADSSNNATVVYPPESFDAESGGSVHDHARAILREAANDDHADDGETAVA